MGESKPVAREELIARYWIETPFDVGAVAEVLAGEQSSGTFINVATETDAMRARFRACVHAIEKLPPSDAPALSSAWLDRRGAAGPYHRAVVTIGFPTANIGANLPTLAAVVAGNLYELGELTGVRLLSLALPPAYAAAFDWPRHGIPGTYRLAGVAQGPIIGTIIKPNIGLTADETAGIVRTLCDAGLDFIKDDEVMADPPSAPFVARVEAVMRAIDEHAQRTGRRVMYAFNISDDSDAMRRKADIVARAGGTCVMASLNWCGFAAMQALRRATDLAIHGHRNGFGALERHPALGLSFAAYQTLWRLAGIDHLHVNGIDGKFSETNDSIAEAARACLAPMAGLPPLMPVFSSGQWAGTAPSTYAATGSADLMFLAGGGILGHPDGPLAGSLSIRQAWDATRDGVSLEAHARTHPELATALAFFSRHA